MERLMNVTEMVRYVNSRHGADFTLGARLSGGFQEGAYLLNGATEAEAVLKITPVSRSIPIIRRLREAGYPTPDFLFWGDAPDGTPYLIQEFFSGVPMEALTPPDAERLIEINRIQAGLNPDPSNREGGWADYIRDVVFANESGWASRVRGHSAETARLMDALDAATAPHAATVLSNADVVHGDWSFGNILVTDGRVSGIVDCAFAGYGPRAYDLATLLHYAYAEDGSPEVRALLREEILAANGESALALFLAARVLGLLDFAITHHGDEGVDAFTQIGWRILRDIV